MARAAWCGLGRTRRSRVAFWRISPRSAGVRAGRVTASSLLERARAIAFALKTREVGSTRCASWRRSTLRQATTVRAYRRLARYLLEQSARRAGRERAPRHDLAARRRHRDRARPAALLRAAATRDPLTGLYNRRHREARSRGFLEAGGIAAAIVDVDHFKRIIDTHSHGVG